MYWISSRGQPKRGGPPAWGLGEVVRTPHRKNYHVAKQSKNLVLLQTESSIASNVQGAGSLCECSHGQLVIYHEILRISVYRIPRTDHLQDCFTPYVFPAHSYTLQPQKQTRWSLSFSWQLNINSKISWNVVPYILVDRASFNLEDRVAFKR
jgi:hypothetical protein